VRIFALLHERAVADVHHAPPTAHIHGETNVGVIGTLQALCCAVLAQAGCGRVSAAMPANVLALLTVLQNMLKDALELGCKVFRIRMKAAVGPGETPGSPQHLSPAVIVSSYLRALRD
jgi:hypothetical protein